MLRKGQFMGLDWNRMMRLQSQVMTGTHELNNSNKMEICMKAEENNLAWYVNNFNER